MAKNKPHLENIQTELPEVSITFDSGSFDAAIISQGVKLRHWTAQRCPIGMVDLNDSRRPHPHHAGCSSGFFYTCVGTVYALMTSNSKRQGMEDAGYASHSSVQCTFATTYEGKDEKLILAPFDRFYLDDESATVVSWETFLCSSDGINRTKYPIECVQGPIIDSRGDRYYQGEDFDIVDKTIHWGARRPANEIDLGPGTGNGFGTDRGSVCSIRYLYLPYFRVGALGHELRFIQVQDGFERNVVRAPQQATLHREYVSQETDQDGEGAGTPTTSEELRRVMAPMYGGFGSK